MHTQEQHDVFYKNDGECAEYSDPKWHPSCAPTVIWLEPWGTPWLYPKWNGNSRLKSKFAWWWWERGWTRTNIWRSLVYTQHRYRRATNSVWLSGVNSREVADQSLRRLTLAIPGLPDTGYSCAGICVFVFAIVNATFTDGYRHCAVLRYSVPNKCKTHHKSVVPVSAPT